MSIIFSEYKKCNVDFSRIERIQKDFSFFQGELLEEKSLKVAEKTVYGWESSATQPDADTLLLLCDIYNIDNILGTFGYTDEEPINLTKHEHHLIEQYRKHPEIQDAVDKLLDIN